MQAIDAIARSLRAPRVRPILRIRSSSRLSHARASVQSRLTVAGEISSAAARLLDAQAAEVAQLDDLGLPLVERREPLERGVERDEIDLAGPPRSTPASSCSSSVMRAGSPPRLAALRRARALHQNLPHRERGNGEEVGAVLPVVRASR